MFKNFKETFKRYDIFSVFCAFLTFTIGCIFIFSASRTMTNPYKYLFVQIFAMILGMGIMYIITIIDYDDITSFWKYIGGMGIMLLILVLIIGQGSESTGTKGWIRIGGIGIQPAEIVKIAFILTLAKHLSSIDEDINYVKNVGLLVLHLIVPVGLIMLQPDAGSAMVFAFIFIIMVFVAGIDRRYIIAAILSFAAFAVVAWQFLLSTYQKERIYAFIYPESAPETYGYHVMQSKIAIGSGRVIGKGLFNGIQTQLGVLPEKHTDFIFAVIGEEGGFILSVFIVILLISLIIRCIIIAQNAKTKEGSYICIGIAAMWIFHVFENIGMTIGLMPVTGIPLPFVSYGGSAIVTNFLALGLIQNVYMRRSTFNFF